MAWQALQIIMTAASLLLPIVVMAQRDVVIKVRYEDKPSSETLYKLGFSNSLFAKFHECLSRGADRCVAKYGLSDCPNCTIVNIRPLNFDQSNEDSNHYYKCKNDASRVTLSCHRLTELPATPPGSRNESYLLRNSSYPSKCFGFVWTFSNEGIQFIDGQFDHQSCGDNCACPSNSTAPTSGTITSSSPSPTGSLSSTPVTPFSSRSSTPSATTPQTSSTKTPTKPTTSVSTENSDSPSTESSSDMENSGDDPSIAVIVGAVVGVIAIIVIIIIIVMVWRRQRAKANPSDHADHETLATSSNKAVVNGKINDGTSYSYCTAKFSINNSDSQARKTNGHQNSSHQPNITKDSVTPVKDLPKPQFAIKDNDSDLGYSKAQLVVSEDNDNTKGKKTHDNYDYVYAEDDVRVPDPDPKTTRNKTTVVSPPKVKYDYAVIDKTGNNKNPGNDVTETDLTNNHYFILEEDYGYSRAEGDAAAKGTNDAAVGKAQATVPTDTLPGTFDQDFGYEYAQASDEYTTVGDDQNTKNVYSRLHEPVRDIQNPYNVGPNTNDVYSKLHEEVRDIKNPYNVLPESQGDEDSNSALSYAAHNTHDTKEQKLPKSLPYGTEDYVVKTKSANKPIQSTFELGNDES